MTKWIKKLAASAAIAGSLATAGLMTAGTANADIEDGARILCQSLDVNPTVSNIWRIRTEMYEAGYGNYFSPVLKAAGFRGPDGQVRGVCTRHHALILAWSYDGWV